jgi:acid phosphatase family membrane protein YuiD
MKTYGILISATIGWLIAGLLKVLIYKITHKKWKWSLVFSTGGMPSSHSAFVSAIALAVGLFSGFNTPAFAVAFALSAVVISDAVGVRRQAGFHAERINLILNEVLKRKQISESQLKEVLGHTPFEVASGVMVGITTVFLIWLIWPK